MGTYMSRGGAKTWWGVDLPKHVIHLYKGDGPSAKWEEYTTFDVIRKKIEKQNVQLWRKRRCSKKMPCFVSVFKFSDDDIWRIAVKTRHRYLVYLKPEQVVSFMEKYNLGVFPYLEFREVWIRAFHKKYKMKPTEYRPIQAGMYCHCVLNENNEIIDFII